MEASPEARAFTERTEQWVSEHLGAIEVSLDAYLRSGEWPQVDELQHRLHVDGSDLDLWSFADALRFTQSSGLGIGSVESDSRIRLRLRAWHALGGLEWYARLIMTAVSAAVRRYLSGMTVLSANDLTSLQSLDDRTWKTVMGLIEQEARYFLLDGPPMTDRNRDRPIDKPRIGRLLHVGSVEDYLLAIAQLHVDQRPGLFATPPEPDILQARHSVTHIHHTYNIQGNVAQLNVGDQQTVHNIQSNLEAVGARGDDALANALKALSETAVAAPDVDEDTRAQLLDAIEEVSDGARLPPEERRLPRIMRAIGYISTTAGAVMTLGKVWQEYGQVIIDHFHNLPHP